MEELDSISIILLRHQMEKWKIKWVWKNSTWHLLKILKEKSYGLIMKRHWSFFALINSTFIELRNRFQINKDQFKFYFQAYGTSFQPKVNFSWSWTLRILTGRQCYSHFSVKNAVHTHTHKHTYKQICINTHTNRFVPKF